MNGYSREVALVFDRLWSGYSKWAASKLISIFDQEFGLAKGKLLDVGCGTGNLVCSFAQAGWEAVGIDLSPDMVNVAHARASTEGIRSAHFKVGRMDDFAQAGPFNAVVCVYDTLNHCADESELSRFLSECRRVLADGGIAVFDFNTARGLQEWNRIRITDRPDVLVVSRGLFMPEKGIAYKRFNGFFLSDGMWVRFEEHIHNIPISAKQIESLSHKAGLKLFRVAALRDLSTPCSVPEGEERVVAFLTPE